MIKEIIFLLTFHQRVWEEDCSDTKIARSRKLFSLQNGIISKIVKWMDKIAVNINGHKRALLPGLFISREKERRV